MAENESRLMSHARELVRHEILIVDGDPTVQKGMLSLLAPLGLVITSTGDPAHALELCAAKFFGVVIVDLDTPAPGGGVELVKKIHAQSPTTIVLVITPRKTFDAAVDAFRAGARDVIMKAPDQIERLREQVLAAAGDVAARGQASTLLTDVRAAMEEFLKTFMESERNRVDLEDKLAGRDLSRAAFDEEMRILVVDGDDRLYQGISKPGVAPGFTFQLAQSGGEALDRITNSRFHIALVGDQLPDMPGSMTIRAIKAQVPDLIAIAYVPNGKLEIVETTRVIPIVDKFTSAAQLVSRLGELAEAHRAKGRERRYIQAFREKHYEFLRRFAELRKKLDQAIDGGGER